MNVLCWKQGLKKDYYHYCSFFFRIWKQCRSVTKTKTKVSVFHICIVCCCKYTYLDNQNYYNTFSEQCLKGAFLRSLDYVVLETKLLVVFPAYKIFFKYWLLKSQITEVMLGVDVDIF